MTDPIRVTRVKRPLRDYRPESLVSSSSSSSLDGLSIGKCNSENNHHRIREIIPSALATDTVGCHECKSASAPSQPRCNPFPSMNHHWHKSRPKKRDFITINSISDAKTARKANAWFNETSEVTEYHGISSTRKRKKKKRRSSAMAAHFCSPACCFLSALGTIILAAAIVAVILGLMGSHRTTTMKTTVTTTATKTTGSTTTSATTTTTSTTPYVCSYSCVNQSWISPSNLVAAWPFDGTSLDETNTYNLSAINNPTFLTNGYLNQALELNSSASQWLVTSYIPLANTSFTVDAWLYPTAFPNAKDHSILGLCSSISNDQCLHLTIRKSCFNYNLYLGFFSDDCQGIASISLNKWIHVAFVFDKMTLKQSIYLNGLLDSSRTASTSVLAFTGNVTIGNIPALVSLGGINLFQGCMDQLTISNRAKGACEILEDATLAARFPFDSGTVLGDFGSNSVATSASSYSILSSGHFLQAIAFDGLTSSYFQASGFANFGVTNQPFSISFWIQPQSRSGTIVHISTLSNGLGAWCFPLMGFALNGTLVAQIYDGMVLSSVMAPSLFPLSSPSWTHLVQTWSSTNGLRLYMDNILVASRTSATTFGATGLMYNYVTIGNSLTGSGSCAAGTISSNGPFTGGIDDLRIYCRELSATDVCALYTA